MPFYLKSIVEPCQKFGCKRQATCQLNDSHNSNWGYFCKQHGELRLAAEKAKFEPVAPRKKR